MQSEGPNGDDLRVNLEWPSGEAPEPLTPARRTTRSSLSRRAKPPSDRRREPAEGTAEDDEGAVPDLEAIRDHIDALRDQFDRLERITGEGLSHLADRLERLRASRADDLEALSSERSEIVAALERIHELVSALADSLDGGQEQGAETSGLAAELREELRRLGEEQDRYHNQLVRRLDATFEAFAAPGLDEQLAPYVDRLADEQRGRFEQLVRYLDERHVDEASLVQQQREQLDAIVAEQRRMQQRFARLLDALEAEPEPSEEGPGVEERLRPHLERLEDEQHQLRELVASVADTLRNQPEPPDLQSQLHLLAAEQEKHFRALRQRLEDGGRGDELRAQFDQLSGGQRQLHELVSAIADSIDSQPDAASVEEELRREVRTLLDRVVSEQEKRFGELRHRLDRVSTADELGSLLGQLGTRVDQLAADQGRVEDVVSSLGDRLSRRPEGPSAEDQLRPHMERLATQQQELHDLIAAVADDLESDPEGPGLSQRLHSQLDRFSAAQQERYEELLRRFDIGISATASSNAAKQLAPHLDRLASGQEQLHELVGVIADSIQDQPEPPNLDEQLLPHLRRLSEEQEARFEQLRQRVEGSLTADELLPQLERLAVGERQRHEELAGEVKRLLGQQQQRHDELLRRLESGFAAAEAPNPADQLAPQFEQVASGQEQLRSLVGAIAGRLERQAAELQEQLGPQLDGLADRQQQRDQALVDRLERLAANELRLEELVTTITETLDEPDPPSAEEQLRPYLERLASYQQAQFRELSQRLDTGLSPEQVLPQLDRLDAGQAQLQELLDAVVDSVEAQPEGPTSEEQLRPHFEQLSEAQERLHDLVAAIADTLDTQPQPPDPEERLRPHLERLSQQQQGRFEDLRRHLEAGLTPDQLETKLTEAMTEQRRQQEELLARIDGAVAAATSRDAAEELAPHFDRIVARQQELHELVAAVTDTLDSQPEVPDPAEALRPQLDRLADAQQARFQELRRQVEQRLTAEQLAPAFQELSEGQKALHDLVAAVTDTLDSQPEPPDLEAVLGRHLERLASEQQARLQELRQRAEQALTPEQLQAQLERLAARHDEAQDRLGEQLRDGVTGELAALRPRVEELSTGQRQLADLVSAITDTLDSQPPPPDAAAQLRPYLERLTVDQQRQFQELRQRLERSLATNRVKPQLEELAAQETERHQELTGQLTGLRPQLDQLGQLRPQLDQLAAGQRQIEDLVSAITDTLDNQPEPPDPGEQLRPHLERLAREQQARFQEVLQRLEASLTPERLQPHLDQLAAQQRSHHDQLVAQLDRLGPLVEDLASKQREVEDLVSAIADGLENAPEEPSLDEQLRPHLDEVTGLQKRHEELLRRLQERATAGASIEEQQQASLHQLAERTAVLEDLANELAEADATIQDTLRALRDEVAELQRRPSTLDPASAELLATAVAERLEAGPATPPG